MFVDLINNVNNIISLLNEDCSKNQLITYLRSLEKDQLKDIMVIFYLGLENKVEIALETNPYHNFESMYTFIFSGRYKTKGKIVKEIVFKKSLKEYLENGIEILDM